MRVKHNKTNKSLACRFCSTESHHSSVRKKKKNLGEGGGEYYWKFMKQKKPKIKRRKDEILKLCPHPPGNIHMCVTQTNHPNPSLQC